MHLKYWNGRGLMEVPRMLLAIAGKFPPGDYADERYGATLPDRGLEANLGRMPIITVGEDAIGQSTAIYYYIAAELGLFGDNTLQGAQILAVLEHVKELRTAYGALVPFGVEPTAEVLDKWFDSGATDVTGPANQEGRSTRFLKWWMGRIEAALTGTNGFAVGNKISLADVVIYATFVDHLRDSEVAADFADHRKGPFGGRAVESRLAAALAAHPRIKASADAVASNENIQRWLATRGTQGF